MNRFRYLGDWLCIAAMSLYVLNRWLVKPLIAPGFMHAYFNDVLLIPAALPPVLAVQRWMRWRDHDRMPAAGEVAMHLLIWAIVCELVGPAVFHRGVADVADVVAYALGGLGAWIWWNRRAFRFGASDRGL